MIKKLEKRNILEWVNYSNEPIIVGEKAPNNEEIMDKINEIIDIINCISLNYEN